MESSESEHEDSENIDELLNLAVASLGGSRRDGQHQMAEAVEDALGAGRHLLVQAGTGTGKSLAYLIPAIVHALDREKPVVVSTATLALQSQVVGRDLPRLVKAISGSLRREPVVAMVKGRRNYLCQHKLNGGYPADDDAGTLFDFGADDSAAHSSSGPAQSKLGTEMVRLRDWARSTKTGDRDELVPGVSEQAWSQVSVNAFDCLGAAKCPVAADCFSELARASAGGADIVVTNHALLAIDAFGESKVLPEHDSVIIDEAHELIDRVTSALSGRLTPTMVSIAASGARKYASTALGALERSGEDFSAALLQASAGLIASGLPDELGLAITAMRDASRNVLGDIGAEAKDDAGSRQMARARLQEIFDLAERIVAHDSSDVVWVERSTFRDQLTISLHIAPLSVAGTMRSGLFAEKTVVATSATLTLGGSFEPLAGSLGLLGEKAPRYSDLDVGSPFDYPRQGILYVAKHLPPPGREQSSEFLTELKELIEAAGGGTLGLFSSRRAAESAAAEMRNQVSVPILCQGDDLTPTLVKRFAASHSACLFGTLSLWQGVDVPGASCRLVVIDRIPFPRPDDPLAVARSNAVASRGGNGFMAVSATHAAVRLAQGAGRLIRRGSDRGVVAILDSRLATARYGGFLRSSLPPLWPTTDGALVRSALHRLDEAAQAD